MRAAIAIIALIASLAAAQAFGMGKMGFNFGREGAIGKRGVAAVSPTGFLLINAGSVMLISTAPSKFKIQ